VAKDNDESKDILFQGASLSQLSQLFKRDNRTTAKKIHGKVKPVGTRLGQPIFDVADAAPFLCPPKFSIQEYVDTMSVADLPTELSKEFWAGMRSRQLFEREQGLLLPIGVVKDVIGAHNKAVRERILLVKEAVERQAELNDRAKVILVDTLDTLLSDIRDAILREFEDPKELNSDIPKVADLDDEL
jgi:hypothetical protein